MTGIVRDNRAEAAEAVEVTFDRIIDARSARTEAGCFKLPG